MMASLVPQHEYRGNENMWMEELSPERSAEFFRYYHRALEVLNEGSKAASWAKIAKPQHNRLVAATRLTIVGFSSSEIESAKAKPYFATPGEADWGC
jgi:hypothetical protein